MVKIKTSYHLLIPTLFLAAMTGIISCEEENRYTSTGEYDPSGNEDDNSGGDSNNGADSDEDDNDNDNGSGNNNGNNNTGCTGVTEEAHGELRPADIVLVVDNSPSMQNEAAAVQRNLNRFADMIIDSGVDVKITVISSTKPGSGYGVCIGKELGSGNCPNDSNLPQFKHINQEVGSTDALVLIHSLYNRWKDMLRPDGQLHFVVVTDDDSRDLTAARFETQMGNVNPPQTDYIFHGIVSSADMWSQGICFRKSTMRGRVYITLINKTGGVWSDLCKQDFDPVFDELANSVISSSMSCEWEIPPPPNGETVDPNKVNVEFDDGNGTKTFPRVDSEKACKNTDQAWYYDNPEEPTKVFMCPQTCTLIRSTTEAKISITFGCDTMVVQ